LREEAESFWPEERLKKEVSYMEKQKEGTKIRRLRCGRNIIKV
jgi:hypothetical protein